MSTEPPTIRVRITKVAEEHATLGFFQNALNAKDIADVIDLAFIPAAGPKDSEGRRWQIADLILRPRDTVKGRRLRAQLTDPDLQSYKFHYSFSEPWFYWHMDASHRPSFRPIRTGADLWVEESPR